jgi:hypothetical protein
MVVQKKKKIVLETIELLIHPRSQIFDSAWTKETQKCCSVTKIIEARIVFENLKN